ncbi:MAG: ABC transporter permease [Deltaproteobacteria bacterium]|nr:ABC transporter permease [Deltaproteobacteria bacterium]
MEFLENAPKTSEYKRFVRVFFGRKVVLLGTIVILAMSLSAIFAPYLAPYDPYTQNLKDALQQPSAKYLLGTDWLGRDTLSRIIYGTRISLAVGVVAVGSGSFIGLMLGLVAGYFGGIVNTLIMRFIDAMMSIPPVMMALAIAAALGGGLTNLMIALCLGFIPTMARLMCGQVLTVKQADYVTAGEMIGCSNLRIMLVHVFPNCLPPLIVMVTLNLGVAILAESGLSFLGVGINPPTATWGGMVSDGYEYLFSNPVLSLAPGICIILIVLAFNIVGDGLRDAFDPRLRGTL